MRVAQTQAGREQAAARPRGESRQADRPGPAWREGSGRATRQERASRYHPPPLDLHLVFPWPHRLAWSRTPPFHGGNEGSNPSGVTHTKQPRPWSRLFCLLDLSPLVCPHVFTWIIWQCACGDREFLSSGPRSIAARQAWTRSRAFHCYGNPVADHLRIRRLDRASVGLLRRRSLDGSQECLTRADFSIRHRSSLINHRSTIRRASAPGYCQRRG